MSSFLDVYFQLLEATKSCFRNMKHVTTRNNNSNESGLLIFNKVSKASSTTVVYYMQKLAVKNNFEHFHVPLKHFFNTTLEAWIYSLEEK